MTQRFDDASLAAILRGLGDGVIIADRDGTIALWNGGAERIFGWTAEEAMGQPLDLIIPERHRRAHNAGYATVMATAVTRYAYDLLQVPALHRNGDTLSIAFTVSLLLDDAGEVEAITAVVRDETARRQADRALRARIQELEGAG